MVVCLMVIELMMASCRSADNFFPMVVLFFGCLAFSKKKTSIPVSMWLMLSHSTIWEAFRTGFRLHSSSELVFSVFSSLPLFFLASSFSSFLSTTLSPFVLSICTLPRRYSFFFAPL
jgi:hypothetical protein